MGRMMTAAAFIASVIKEQKIKPRSLFSGVKGGYFLL